MVPMMYVFSSNDAQCCWTGCAAAVSGHDLRHDTRLSVPVLADDVAGNAASQLRHSHQLPGTRHRLQDVSRVYFIPFDLQPSSGA